ncbi:unnamed protein product [Rotaria magnacalcarata]|uniref:Chitinase n=1 Tax=Rotaria magnacalcarata TaxID=392030 RepID=A0A8S3EWI6_9BILA|nr:unnamed protein product [Rotaria magnacalcarata]
MAQYAKAEQLGGVFIWSIDNDEFSGFFCNTEPFPITRQVFSTLNLPVPATIATSLAIQQRIPSIIAPITVAPTVRFINVQAQNAPVSSAVPNNLQQLLSALSALSATTTYASIPEPSAPPPVAHQTYNAEYICARHHAGRNGIYRDRTNCSIFYFCEGTDLASLRYHIFFCPAGLEFSMDACTCDWPTGRVCQTTSETFCVSHSARTTTTTATTTTTKPTTVQSNIPQSALIALNGLGQLLGVSSGSTPMFDCVGRRSGLYRDMYDCTKFYFCTTNNQAADGGLLRYDFVCPANYAFSMTTCRCELGQSHTCHTLTKTDCLLL